ncbi:hypothetical protein FYC62_04330 [Pedobacter aquae]|uniref:Glyoxalase n=1 Tax=Pedobacter aquae TaxID=2605747 RepID=A0A5C0VJ01_9SPHI|nr:hypothetical protein [Pedobacter aquae]QEK50984.1 hypothetical protein FYC62_04330 [Pedobacter aquae]
MNRDEFLLHNRPEIVIENPESIREDLSKFQNFTLRAVLKVQNDVLLRICTDFLQKNYKNFSQQQSLDKVKLLQQALKSNIQLKTLLFGVIAGFLTSQELDFYLQNASEINKRLSAFIFKRVSEQL